MSMNKLRLDIPLILAISMNGSRPQHNGRLRLRCNYKCGDEAPGSTSMDRAMPISYCAEAFLSATVGGVGKQVHAFPWVSHRQIIG